MLELKAVKRVEGGRGNTPIPGGTGARELQDTCLLSDYKTLIDISTLTLLHKVSRDWATIKFPDIVLLRNLSANLGYRSVFLVVTFYVNLQRINSPRLSPFSCLQLPSTMIGALLAVLILAVPMEALGCSDKCRCVGSKSVDLYCTGLTSFPSLNDLPVNTRLL